MELRELENQHADVLPERFARAQERRAEHFCAQKMIVPFSREAPVTRQIGEVFDRDGVRDFERETEVRRDWSAELCQPLLGRELVVARIDANRVKGLRVFFQTGGLEFRLREFLSRQVALLVVELSAPARIFP